MRCLDGGAPENLAITMDESGQTFLEFDTVEGNSYSIEATDSLSPPAWTAVWTLTGDGQRATWLTTARRWSRTFGEIGEDVGFSVEQTSDGGYIVAGSTNSFGADEEDVYLIKIDEEGNEVWSNTFGEYGLDLGHSVQQTSDDGYILAGFTNSFGAGELDWDVYLIKTDADGNEVWSRTFGEYRSDLGHSVQQTSDGGYILAGFTNSFGAGELDPDVYLIKTDVQGNEVWRRTFGGYGSDQGYSVQQTSDGGYILAGVTNSFGAGELDRDVYLIKTDVQGNEVWSRTFGEADPDHASSVRQTSDGGYIVAGWTESFGAGGQDVYLIKTDADGNEIWSRTFGGADDDEACSVQQTTDGGYIVAGYTWSFGAGEQHVYLVKTDQNGNAPPLPTWVTVWGDDFEDHTPVYEPIGAPWTVISGSNDPIPGDQTDYGTWRLWNTQGDRLGKENPAIFAMTGNYAITDSDLHPEPLLNEELITPDIDCTNHRQVHLDFNMNYRVYAEDADHEQIAEVDIRTSHDGLTWSDWTNLQRWDRTTVANIVIGSQHVDISAIADGKHIRIRFHFYDAMYDWWFAVDNVCISGIALPEEIPVLGGS